MTKLHGYRISTAIFALLFAAVMIRDLVRSDPESAPRALDRAASAPSPLPAVSPEDESPAESPALGSTPPAGVEADRAEPPVDLAMRLLLDRDGPLRDGWGPVLAELHRRREEVAPLLEDWLCRREQLEAQGINLEFAICAWADLVGEAALPLLVEIIGGGQYLSGTAGVALTRVDSPRAAELLVRYQEDRRARSTFVRIETLWQGKPPFQDVVRRWARQSPAGHEKLGKDARRILFWNGTPADREELWKSFDLRIRLYRIGGANARKWGGAWPERYRATLAEGLRSEVVGLRYRAVWMIQNDVRNLDDGTSESDSVRTEQYPT